MVNSNTGILSSMRYCTDVLKTVRPHADETNTRGAAELSSCRAIRHHVRGMKQFERSVLAESGARKAALGSIVIGSKRLEKLD